MDKISKLKPIQMPPRALLTVVIQRSRLAGLRTDQRTTRMGNVDVNPLSLRIQKYPNRDKKTRAKDLNLPLPNQSAHEPLEHN